MIRLFLVTLMLYFAMDVFSQNKDVELSQVFLKRIRSGELVEEQLKALAELNFDLFTASLDSDAERLAFWINIYNGVTQLRLKEHPEYFEDRGSFYSRKLILIAGESLCLDEIEHGILRRNTSKYSLGYIRKWGTRKCIKKWMVKHIDARIHYALNCGARSCPPVMFYDDTRLEQQLNISCLAYLEQECVLKKEGEKQILEIPALFSWFRGDFGGKKGIRRFLIRYEILKEGEKYELRFKDYDWTLALGNYKEA